MAVLDVETGNAGGGNFVRTGPPTSGGGDEFFHRDEAETRERRWPVGLISYGGNVVMQGREDDLDILLSGELGRLMLQALKQDRPSDN